ncbi:MAG TPA: signal peptidase I [Thermoanaerobaculia bacterium]|jgi:signal peptidase I|nr:signal peptidase I [Thermoanaerobaculia bacterium]
MRQTSLARTILQPLGLAVALGLIVRGALHIYAIPSDSMAPTLHAGDQIVVTPYLRATPNRGDVIVFESLTTPDELMVKRVIGVPGDLLDSRLGRVRISGYTLPEPYILRQGTSGALPAQLVAAESYFVMGDNRDDSSDSRSWGLVPRSRIVGRARMVLWSSASAVGDEARAAARKDPAGETRVRPRGGLFKWIE